jgi:Xaa-Pro aminopeptidase
MDKRLSAAKRIMRTAQCTHLLVTDPVDAEYISSFRASRIALLIGRTKNFLCTDARYGEAAARFCAKNRAWSFARIKGNDAAYLSALLGRRAALAFQSDAVTVDELAKLKKTLKNVRFVPVPAEVSGLGIIKSARELASMREAARIGDRALRRFLTTLRSGVSERAAAGALDRLCSTLGSERPAFDTIVLFGACSSLPHGRPGGRKLKKGDFVLVDFGCTVNGLCSDMTRTAVYGRASPRQRALYAAVACAQAAGRLSARPGMKASALDAAARQIIAAAGYGEAFGHGLGHGVGRRIHEAPRIASTSTEKLRAGSVITIEPGVYLPGRGGVRIEDMVVITKNGCRCLTNFPRKLREIKIR